MATSFKMKKLSNFILCPHHRELTSEIVEQEKRKFIVTAGVLEYPNNTEYWVIVFVLDRKGKPESVGFLKEEKTEGHVIHEAEVIANALRKKMFIYNEKEKKVIDLVDLL